MSIWAIADLHLCFGVPEKSMELFGDVWSNYTAKIEARWREMVAPEDLVLIPGDISWAMDSDRARVDLDWIDALPGTKVMIRGNHDYWWSSLAKVQKILPPSCHVIQNNAFFWKGVAIAGARLWDTDEFSFENYIDFTPRPVSEAKPAAEEPDREKIFLRELNRLELSLKAMDKRAEQRIAMTHYPPVSADLADSRVSALLEQYGVSVCVFGHLHSLKKDLSLFGIKNGIRYALTACDYLEFKPLNIR